MNDHELSAGLRAVHLERTRYPDLEAVRQHALTIPFEQVPQQRGWLPRIDTGRFQSMFSATKFVVAGVIVALFGGFLLTGVLTTQPSDDPLPAAVSSASVEPDASEVAAPTTEATTAPESTTTTNPTIELPAEIPEGIKSGTLKTPLGPARWVHLSGELADLAPNFRDVVSTPEGFITLERLDDGATLWRSPNLLTWTSQPLDILAWQLSYTADGTYWLNSGNVWWRSQDTASWEQVDLGNPAPPQRDGYAYADALHLNGPPVEHDGVTIVPYGWGPDYGVVTQDHPLAEQTSGFTEIEPGIYGLAPHIAYLPVRFEQIEGGLRMIDHQDGTELKVLDGISMEFIERLGSDEGDLAVPGLVMVEGDESVEVELPDDMRRADRLWYTTDGPGFTAYALTDGLMTVHRSQDGRDWRQVTTIGDDAGEPTDIHSVSLYDYPTSAQTDRGLWTTADGLTWHMRPHQAAHRFGAGWIRGGNSFPWWYYPDRGKVVRIDHSAVGLPPKSECNGNPRPISSNTLYMSCKREGVRDTWIITFDDVPA